MKGLDVGHIEDKLYKGLSSPLPSCGGMDHDVRTALGTNELDNTVVRQLDGLEAEVSFVEAHRFCNILSVNEQPVEYHYRAPQPLAGRDQTVEPLAQR